MTTSDHHLQTSVILNLKFSHTHPCLLFYSNYLKSTKYQNFFMLMARYFYWYIKKYLQFGRTCF